MLVRGGGCVKIRLLNGSPRNAVLVQNVLCIQVMPEVPEPSVKACENYQINPAGPDIVNQSLEIVPFQFLAGNSVVNIVVNQNHVFVRFYVFLAGRKLVTHGIPFLRLLVRGYTDVYCGAE